MKFYEYEDIEIERDFEESKVILEIGKNVVELTLPQAEKLKDRIRKAIICILTDGQLDKEDIADESAFEEITT